MGIPIAELQERISSHEFAEYWVHYGLEPWGLEREDLRSGIVASTIANANRDPKKRPRPFTPDQFMPRFDREDVADDDELDEDEAAAHAARIDELMAGLGDDAATEAVTVRRAETSP
jgi:hypothetical protein